MQPHGLGRFFWHTVKLTGAPRVHRGRSAQYDWPYRYARPLIFRLPWGRGLAVGWWRDHKELDIGGHLAEAMVLHTGESWGCNRNLITSDSSAERGEDGQRLEVTVTIL